MSIWVIQTLKFRTGIHENIIVAFKCPSFHLVLCYCSGLLKLACLASQLDVISEGMTRDILKTKLSWFPDPKCISDKSLEIVSATDYSCHKFQTKQQNLQLCFIKAWIPKLFVGLCLTVCGNVFTIFKQESQCL